MPRIFHVKQFKTNNMKINVFINDADWCGTYYAPEHENEEFFITIEVGFLPRVGDRFIMKKVDTAKLTEQLLRFEEQVHEKHKDIPKHKEIFDQNVDDCNYVKEVTINLEQDKIWVEIAERNPLWALDKLETM